MSELRLLKLIVQVVAVEVDENGDFIGEKVSDPNVFYNEAGAVNFVHGVRGTLAAATNGGSDGEVKEGDGVRGGSRERRQERGRVESEG